MSSIFKVAEHAGVSTATVSRVINDAGTVKEATRDRVLAAIDALSYRANTAARNLRTARSHMLLVLVPGFDNPFYAGIVGGIDREARAQGYHTLLCDTAAEANTEQTYAELLESRVADVAICLDPIRTQSLSGMLGMSLPWIACCEFDASRQVPYVGIDNLNAAVDVVRFLVSRGRRRIAFIGADERFLYAQARRMGYNQALAEANLVSPGTAPLVARLPDYDEGYRLTRQLLEDCSFDAVFAVSDTLAIGAIRALEDAGVNVPDEVSVVGFDNVPFAAMVRPGLTTISQPAERLGRNAVRLALDRIEHPMNDASGLILDHELVVRGST